MLFFQEDFSKWMMSEAVRQQADQIVSHKDIFICCKASSAHKLVLLVSKVCQLRKTSFIDFVKERFILSNCRLFIYVGIQSMRF